MDEQEIVDAIRLVVDAPEPGVRVGIGDDAAVADFGGGDVVLSADMLVDGVDFHLPDVSPRDLGAKSISVNLSDLAAMGASPRCVLVSLALPPGVDVPWVVDLYGGMRDVCESHACSIVGGDLSSSSQLVIAVSVAGSIAPGGAVPRSGAQVGDLLVVTGPLGGAAGGLAISRLEPGVAARIAATDAGRGLLEALTRPAAQVAQGQFLASRGARAMIDLSDGLSRDLHRLCRASQVGAALDANAVPIDPRLFDVPLDVDPSELALTGGEDFALLAAVPPDDIEGIRADFLEQFFVELTVIGHVVIGPGVVIEKEEVIAVLPDEGWDHFA